MKHLPTLACLALSVLFAIVFNARHGGASDCLVEASSSCVTPQGYNLLAGGAVWGVVSIGFLLIAFVSFWRSR